VCNHRTSRLLTCGLLDKRPIYRHYNFFRECLLRFERVLLWQHDTHGEIFAARFHLGILGFEKRTMLVSLSRSGGASSLRGREGKGKEGRKGEKEKRWKGGRVEGWKEKGRRKEGERKEKGRRKEGEMKKK
jgi:hypothetical protein